MDGTQVSVPNLVGLSPGDARSVAHRAFLIAAGPDRNVPIMHMTGTVVRQSPVPGAIVERWSVVFVWTRGDGDAGDRVPRDPGPPLREVIVEMDPESGTATESVLE
jgi:beta-lactam-binding protein with PASTA domain